MISAELRQQAARALHDAERTATPIAPLTQTYEGIDVVDAYQIQLAQIGRRVEEGAVVRGHKVGLSSAAMQRMLKVSEPDYGHLLDDMFVYETDPVPVSALCFPRIEMEVAFVLARPLSGPGCTVADVLAATAYVAPALEIIDSRVVDWKIGLVDTIADNASSARVVLGGCATPVDAVDLRTVGAVLRKNGEIAETGAAGAVLGNPATAVAWLANKVHQFGVTLGEGHVVLPGACSRAIDVAPGDVIRADFDTLGHVSVRFGE
ncbi:MAG: fumarylacetoacetate hydrolase family protein [Myxococcales bacterium]|nr:fumarylacetoacetate hydrolase family protein [Myxococcales bacterium]